MTNGKQLPEGSHQAKQIVLGLSVAQLVALERMKDINSQTYMTKSQVADYLGVSPRTVDNLMARRTIPFFRLSGRTVRFPKAVLDAHIERSLMVESTCKKGCL